MQFKEAREFFFQVSKEYTTLLQLPRMLSSEQCHVMCLQRRLFKGQCHEMDIFLSLNILISTICVCADGFQWVSKAFHNPKQLLTFYLLL
jgi:hypothetical protein